MCMWGLGAEIGDGRVGHLETASPVLSVAQKKIWLKLGSNPSGIWKVDLGQPRKGTQSGVLGLEHS